MWPEARHVGTTPDVVQEQAQAVSHRTSSQGISANEACLCSLIHTHQKLHCASMSCTVKTIETLDAAFPNSARRDG